MSIVLSKKQMTEEDIKLNYITPAILKGWKGHITMEILRAALQRKAEIENIRLYFLCGEKCSTLKRLG